MNRLLAIGREDVVGHRRIGGGQPRGAFEAAGGKERELGPGLGATDQAEHRVRGDHGEVGDGGDVGVVLLGIHDHRDRANGLGEAEDGFDGVFRCGGGSGDDPAGALEERGIGVARTNLGLAGHRVSADEADPARQVLGGGGHGGALGGAGVGDDGALRKVRRDVLKHAVVGEHRGGEDDQVRVADGVGDIRLDAINRADLLRLTKIDQLSVVANELEVLDL